MSLSIDALLLNSYKTLQIISGIRSDCTGGESFDKICSKVIGSVYVELCSEFDERISNLLQDVEKEYRSISVIMNKKSESLKGSKTLKLNSVLSELKPFQNKFDEETGKITANVISSTPVVELQQRAIATITKSLKIKSTVASGLSTFNDFNKIKSELEGSVISYTQVDDNYSTDYKVLEDMMKNIRSLITWINSTREAVYAKLKGAKEMKERDIAYNVSLGKYRSAEASHESAKTISLLSQGYAISESILEFYLVIVLVGLGDLKKIIE